MGQESRRLPGSLLIPINQAVDAKQITDTLTGPAGGGGWLPWSHGQGEWRLGPYKVPGGAWNYKHDKLNRWTENISVRPWAW